MWGRGISVGDQGQAPILTTRASILREAHFGMAYANWHSVSHTASVSPFPLFFWVCRMFSSALATANCGPWDDGLSLLWRVLAITEGYQGRTLLTCHPESAEISGRVA